MSGLSSQRDIGGLISARQSVVPQAISGSSAVNGSWIDRLALNNPLSCVLHTMLGAVTGAPTSFTVTPKLQHSPDNGTTVADFDTGAAALAAADAEGSRNIDLSGANRYVRVVVTPAFTGGTSPTVEAAADIIFGGEQELPAA